METIERERGVAIVIEPQAHPGVEGVTASTHRAGLGGLELTCVMIHMATQTLLRSAIEPESDRRFVVAGLDPMAVETSGPSMSCRQRVIRALMIELDLTPTGDPVTALAIPLQHEAVDARLVWVAMAGTANRRRENIGSRHSRGRRGSHRQRTATDGSRRPLKRHMAEIAGYRPMGSLERVSGLLMP